VAPIPNRDKGRKKKCSLSELLQEGRLAAGLTQMEVAHHLGLRSSQSVSDWERGKVTSAPMSSLRKLIILYGLDENIVFDALFEVEMERLEEKLRTEFYDAKKKA